MHGNYARCYEALDVPPGAEWPCVRAAYRELVRKWHPDRFPHNAEQRTFAEEKIKEITEAYRLLEQYYRETGETPGASFAKVRNEKTQDTNTRYETANHDTQPRDTHESTASEPYQPFTGATLFRRRVAIIGAAIAIMLLIIFALSDDAPTDDPVYLDEQEPIPAPQELPNPPDVAHGPYFTVGSTLGEVYSIQGVPTKIDGDNWYYGRSSVHFAKGTVSHWQSHPDSPLKARTTGVDAATRPVSFGQGSSKEEVRVMQGTPSRETETLWEYGASKVYFKGDRVTGWHESPLFPLKVAK